MIKYIEDKFNAMKHLKVCKNVVENVYELLKLQINFDRSEAIIKISEIVLENEKEFNKIAEYGTEKPVVHATHDEFMQAPERTELTYKEDIAYVIDCYILISAVKYGLEESIESGLEKIALEYQESN